VRSTVVALLCLILLTACASAFAAETGGLMGRSEVMGAAAWAGTSVQGEDFNGFLLGASYGKFVTPNVEIQLSAIYGTVSALGEDLDALLLGPAAVYYFVPKEKKAAMLPYLGAGLVYARASGLGESDSSVKLQYMGGVKFFIGGDYETANKAVFVEYRHASADMFGENVGVDIVWTGLSCFF
jgi:outer membrane protein W